MAPRRPPTRCSWIRSIAMLVPRPRRLFETQPVCRYQHLSRVP
jgi:hypothetical protein